MLLIGGPPFPETILMWWNFVARSPDEIAEARTDWEERRRFGEVVAYDGPRLAAPDLARLARPNPVKLIVPFPGRRRGLGERVVMVRVRVRRRRIAGRERAFDCLVEGRLANLPLFF